MNDAHKVASDLAYAAKIFDGSGRMVLDEVGLQLKPVVGQAVRRDIGDQSMSGWRRGNPIAINGRYDIKADSTLVVVPERKATGPMSVLSFGRSGYSAGDMRRSGSYVSKKTGQRKDKTRRVKGTVGATRGKGTWTEAERVMERDAPAAFVKAIDRVAVKARLGRG